MGIDLLTLFWIAFAAVVVGVVAIAFGAAVGAAAFVVWCGQVFRARQQRRIRIERRA